MGAGDGMLKLRPYQDDAADFRTRVDRALVRDVELELAWNGDADIDLIVEEPPGTVCSLSSPRSSSGGVLLADTDAAADEAAGAGNGSGDAAGADESDALAAANTDGDAQAEAESAQDDATTVAEGDARRHERASAVLEPTVPRQVLVIAC